MKCWLILFAALTIAIDGYAQYGFKGEKGVSSAGITGGYVVGSKAPAIGFDFRYNIGDRLRLAPSFLYVFNTDSLVKTTTVYFNADLHYLVRLTEKATLYPLIGAGLGLWSFDLKNFYSAPDRYDGHEGIDPFLESRISEKDVEELEPNEFVVKHNRLGLNIGLGWEYRLTRDFILGAEFKYHLTEQRAFDQAMFLARLAYYF